MPTGSAQLRPPPKDRRSWFGDHGRPLHVTPSTTHAVKVAGWRAGQVSTETQSPRRGGWGGCRQGCRGRAGNLPPPAGVLELRRPRPVAPRRASCRDVAGSLVAAAGSGRGGAGAAPEAAGAGPCRGATLGSDTR